jgi:hypothetical protein
MIASMLGKTARAASETGFHCSVPMRPA